MPVVFCKEIFSCKLVCKDEVSGRRNVGRIPKGRPKRLCLQDKLVSDLLFCMPINVTNEVDLSLFPMGACITGISDEGYVREGVTARQVIDASDMFSNLGPLGISNVLIKFGFNSLGPVCEMLEQVGDIRSGATDKQPNVPGVYVATVHEPVVTQYRLQNKGLDTIGLKRLTFDSPDELAADGSLLADRVKRMGGTPKQVAKFMFNNIPNSDILWLDKQEP